MAASAVAAAHAPNPLEFIHIPKTGGQAIEAWGLHHGLAWGGCRLKAGGPSWPVHPGRFGSYTKGCSSFHIPPAAWEAAQTPPFAAGAPTFCVVRHPFARAVSEYQWQAKWTPYWRACTAAGSKGLVFLARRLRLLSARPAAPGRSEAPRASSRQGPWAPSHCLTRSSQPLPTPPSLAAVGLAGTAANLNEVIERVFASGIDPHGGDDEPAEGGGAAGAAAESGSGPTGPHVPPGLGARLILTRTLTRNRNRNRNRNRTRTRTLKARGWRRCGRRASWRRWR